MSMATRTTSHTLTAACALARSESLSLLAWQMFCLLHCLQPYTDAHVANSDVAGLQMHFDGCFKFKHLASAGRRSNAAELDAQVPGCIFMRDAERDERDARLARQVTARQDMAKTCNDFKADCAGTGHAPTLACTSNSCCDGVRM